MAILSERAPVENQPEDQSRTHSQPAYGSISWRGRLGHIILGLASLAWLGLRSGTRPSRLVYPCQRVAATNGLGFLAYIASLIASMRLYRHAREHMTFGRLVLLVAALILMAMLQGEVTRPALLGANPTLPAWTSPDAVSDVFAVTNVPTPTVSLEGGVIPGGVSPVEALRDSGVDTLVNLMASQGIRFYKTIHQPNGIFAPDDVVVIKVNAQWNCNSGDDNRRAHTNIDVVKGVIYRIVQHPEGFTGAVIVTDNGQGVPAQLDCTDYNNAQDAHQSYQDVTDAFVNQGYDVCTYTWDNIRDNFVSEYISGSIESGYVLVQDGTPGTDQLSYPKFEVTCGSHTYQISMRYGLWNGTTYDNTRLKMVNLPVVKRHGMAGATIAVKNYIGFLTTANREARFGDFTEMHDFFWGYVGGSDYGLLGRQLALIRRADLNIVDAIWVNPTSNTSGADSAVRDDVLLVSTDPFALDYYSSAYVLLPHITPGSDAARDADARYRGGEFRGLLLTNENRARLKGLTDIIDLDDGLTVDEEQAQFNVFVADASAPPDVTLSLTAEPTSRAIQVGQTAAYTLSPVINGGYVRPVTFALSGAPAETIVSLAPNPVVPPGTSRLYITTTASTATGTYTMTVTGSADQVTDTTSLTLVMESAFTPTLTLTVQPVVHTVLPGDTAAYTLSLTASEGFTAPVTLTLQGAPSGTFVSFDPNPITPPGISQLYITTTASTAAGTYVMTVTGMSETLSDKADLALIVASEAPSFTLSLSPTTRIAGPNQVISYTAVISRVNSFSQPVTLNVVGCPTGIGIVWSINPVTLDGSSVLTLSVPSDPPFGEHALQVVGTAEIQTVAEGIQLVIDYPFRVYLPAILK
jgi:hypothetical protein